MPKRRKKARSGMPSSSYITMPHYSHYFPIQVDVIKGSIKPKKQKKKK